MVRRSVFLAALILGLVLPGARAAACPFDSDDCGARSFAPVEPPTPPDFWWGGGEGWHSYVVQDDTWFFMDGSHWDPSSKDAYPPSVEPPSLLDIVINAIDRFFSPAPDERYFPDGIGDRG